MEIMIVVYVVAIAAFFAGLWGVFTKAGEPGWAGIVPIYNYMILGRICGKGDLFGLLMLIPCVNLVVFFMLCSELAKRFGKESGYAIGLFLLGPIFFPMLGFGDAQYQAGRGSGRGRRRIDDDDDYDDDGRGRGRGRDRDDDEDDDRPRGRGRSRDDDDDDRPRRR
jgi:hypothetical protein